MNNVFVNDAELAILSTIIKDADYAYMVDDLKPFMFSSKIHRRLYSEIEDFIERQLIPEPHLLITSLGADNSLDSIGGEAFIHYLMELDFSKDNFKEFVRMVVDAYKTRSFLTLTNVDGDDLLNAPIDDVIYELRGNLDKLVQTTGGGTTRHIGSNITETFGNITARLDNPGIRGGTWGLENLDLVSGGKSPGDMWIFGGRPGAGKTAAICNSILADAKAGTPALLIEKEMNFQTLIERLLSIELGIPLTKIRQGLLSQEDVDKIHDTLGTFKDYPIYIDSNFSSSMSYLESTVRKYHNTKGTEVVYIDYLQLMVERDEGMTHALGRISRNFKLLANDLNITPVLVSQLNRAVELRDNKRPIMSDLRQSGNLEEDADFIIGLYRDDYYNSSSKDKGTMEYIVLKNRNGPVGTLAMKFDAPTNKIISM